MRYIIPILFLACNVYGAQVQKTAYTQGASTASWTYSGEVRISTSINNIHTRIRSTGTVETNEIVASNGFIGNLLSNASAQATYANINNPSFTGTVKISAQTRYYSVSPYDFIGLDETQFDYYDSEIKSQGISAVSGGAPVHLPNGATVTSFKVYWFRDDAAAAGTARLARNLATTGVSGEMAAADTNATTGNHSVEDTSIANATIDNTSYSYCIPISMDANDNYDDVKIRAVVITYTVTELLP